MQLLRVLLLASLMILSGCGAPSTVPAVNSLLVPYLDRPGVDPAGGNAVVVRLSWINGSALTGPGRDAGTPAERIRLLIRPRIAPSSIPDATDLKHADEGRGFVRYFPPSTSLWRGVLVFTGPEGHRVEAVQSFGDSPGAGNYLAVMQMDGVYLQYLYAATNHEDHLRAAEIVHRWFNAQPHPRELDAPAGSRLQG